MEQINKVYIKGMVCQRCISIVKNQLESAGFILDDVNLGEVIFSATSSITDASLIDEKLRPLGLSVLEDKRKKIVRDVKLLVAEVYNGKFDFRPGFRFSELVSKKIGKDYDAISMTFSSSENSTLEKYIIDYRIEKAKEFLVYTSESLADISFKLGFSSVAHLSRQFKQQTGLTPSYFKNLKLQKWQFAEAN
jgi:AraC-like DNA-binding protein